MGFRSTDFPEAECYYAEAISLPMFPQLSEATQKTICDKLGEALGA
jgi:dTDP-4-amino-4,6-dideoxygalactose transaminase